MIVQVTGSREVTPEDRPILEAGLRHVVGGTPGPHTLRHGEAPGADTIFAEIANDWGWTVKGLAADWSGPCRDTCKPGHRRPRRGGGTYCPQAGHYRNQEMVDEGADYAVAAYKRGAKNSGRSDCVKRIRAAGIDVHRVVVP